MRLLKYIIFLETKVLELWTNWEINVWRSHFFCVVEPLSLLKASRRVPLFWRPCGFHYLSSHGILRSSLQGQCDATCEGRLSLSGHVYQIQIGWLLYRYNRLCWGTYCTWALVFPIYVMCKHRSNQVANSLLTCKVKCVLILGPGSYFKITTALNRW